MKTVFNNSEVCHIWASQSQKEGRAGHIFFEGDSIFSYGRHFEMARHVDGVVLMTTSDYSVTTQRHKYDVRHAVSHKQLFEVPSFTDHNENASYYLQTLETLRISMMRARKGIEWRKEGIDRLIEEARAYLQKFGKQITEKNSRALIDAFISTPELEAKIKEKIKAQRAATKEERIKKEAAAVLHRAEALEKLEEWKTGKIDQMNSYYGHDVPIALRVKDDRIETSRGAQILLKTGVALWKRIVKHEAVTGMTLDHYTVNSEQNGILTVGCHQIPMDEIRRIALSLNLQPEVK